MARPEQWCVRTAGEGAGEGALEALPPLELAGQEVDAVLPRGTGAARWHALMNEIQMVLHEHPLNAERERRGDPPINSVWLWGAGRLPAAAEGRWHSVTADDALAAGLARIARIRQQALPAGARNGSRRAPRDGRHLVVLDSLRAALALGGADGHVERLAALESRWFVPLLEALRGDRIGMVTVQVPDAGDGYETVRSDLRRFWRRAPAACGVRVKIVVRPYSESDRQALVGAGVHPLLARLYAGRRIRSANRARARRRAAAAARPAAARDARRCAARRCDRAGTRGSSSSPDYDADGATACAVGMRALRRFGATVDYLVPDRFKLGYGLSPELVDLAHARSPDLLIT
jgi:hypothetical protein